MTEQYIIDSIDELGGIRVKHNKKFDFIEVYDANYIPILTIDLNDYDEDDRPDVDNIDLHDWIIEEHAQEILDELVERYA